jgi:hypothetical protein
MPDLGSQFRQYSAAEVQQMSPDEALNTRKAAGRAQRGEPEAAMNRYQHTMGGGVMGHVMEHTGDLTHRMNQHPEGYAGLSIAVDDSAPKIDRMSHALNHPYGFEKEMGENLRSNAAYKGQDIGTHTVAHDSMAKTYADAHRRLPVYNYPSEVARDTAVAVGEQRFDAARAGISTLHSMHHGGKDSSGESWAEGDMRGLLEHSQESMVDYLRGKESRTPEITRAATSMLGGPPK